MSTLQVVSPSSRFPSPTQLKKVALDSPYTAPLLITVILIIGELSFHFLESYTRTALAITTSILVELTLGLLLNRRVPNLASAYVSGISCGILVRSPEFWPYALCAAISILSKYVIRVNGRHLWNPSNLGIAALLLLAPQTVTSLSIQWGNTLAPMLIIWTLGSLIIWRLRRFHICATYVVSFLAYGLLRSAITGSPWQSEISPITGPMYQLFIFFMITDPKTTTRTRWGQMTVAFLVATMESLIRFHPEVHSLNLLGYDWIYAPYHGLVALLGPTISRPIADIGELATHAPYFALFLMGPSANLIEITATAIHKKRNGTTVEEPYITTAGYVPVATSK